MKDILINFLMIILVTFLFDYIKNKRMYAQFSKDQHALVASTNSLKKGDKVLVSGSIVGIVLSDKDGYVQVEVAKDVIIEVVKTALLKI